MFIQDLFTPCEDGNDNEGKMQECEEMFESVAAESRESQEERNQRIEDAFKVSC